MKRGIHIFLSIFLFAACISSCNKKNPDISYYDATVTFRQTENGGCFLVVNDSTLLYPQNISKYPFSSEYPEKRAVIAYQDNGEATPSRGFKYARNIVVGSIYGGILTKQPVVSDPLTDDARYGTEPLGLYFEPSFPSTVLEDGYLNVSFAFNSPIPAMHYINLLTNVDGDSYKVELRHRTDFDAVSNGSEEYYSGNSIANGVMSFPLKGLKDTEGRTVKLTLVWRSINDGEKKSVTFDYRTRTDWPVNLYSDLLKSE